MYAQSQKKNDFSTVFDKENLLLRQKNQAGGTNKTNLLEQREQR